VTLKVEGVELKVCRHTAPTYEKRVTYILRREDARRCGEDEAMLVVKALGDELAVRAGPFTSDKAAPYKILSTTTCSYGGSIFANVLAGRAEDIMGMLVDLERVTLGGQLFRVVKLEEGHEEPRREQQNWKQSKTKVGKVAKGEGPAPAPPSQQRGPQVQKDGSAAERGQEKKQTTDRSSQHAYEKRQNVVAREVAEKLKESQKKINNLQQAAANSTRREQVLESAVRENRAIAEAKVQKVREEAKKREEELRQEMDSLTQKLLAVEMELKRTQQAVGVMIKTCSEEQREKMRMHTAEAARNIEEEVKRREQELEEGEVRVTQPKAAPQQATQSRKPETVRTARTKNSGNGLQTPVKGRTENTAKENGLEDGQPQGTKKVKQSESPTPRWGTIMDAHDEARGDESGAMGQKSGVEQPGSVEDAKESQHNITTDGQRL
jgi:hypothetical protein